MYDANAVCALILILVCAFLDISEMLFWHFGIFLVVFAIFGRFRCFRLCCIVFSRVFRIPGMMLFSFVSAEKGVTLR